MSDQSTLQVAVVSVLLKSGWFPQNQIQCFLIFSFFISSWPCFPTLLDFLTTDGLLCGFRWRRKQLAPYCEREDYLTVVDQLGLIALMDSGLFNGAFSLPSQHHIHYLCSHVCYDFWLWTAPWFILLIRISGLETRPKEVKDVPDQLQSNKWKKT